MSRDKEEMSCFVLFLKAKKVWLPNKSLKGAIFQHEIRTRAYNFPICYDVFDK